MNDERLPFFASCVEWPRPLLPALETLVEEGEKITRETFFRHVSAADIPADWYPHRRYYGYGFYRLRGRPVYWYTHSCIEFVFATPETISAIAAEADALVGAQR